MKHHTGNGERITILASLLLATSGLFSPLHAQESYAPAQPVMLISNPTQAQGNGPLRVVIPNITPETATQSGASPGAPLDTPMAASPPVSTSPPVFATVPQEYRVQPAPSKIRQIAKAVTQTAQSAWDNGVSLAEWGQEYLSQKILRPNIPFAPMPSQWALNPQPATQQIAAMPTAEEMANLAPAAGGNQPSMPPAAPIIPQLATDVTMPTADTSEPTPTLSSQSKAMIDKVPRKVADQAPEKPLPGKVDISRATNVPTVLDTPVQEERAKSLGINQGGQKKMFDTNYELERAYNALVAGQSEEALRIYEDILTGNPNNKDALFGLASTYHRAGQIDMARTLYGKLLKLDPKHRDGLNNFLVLLADEAPQEALAQMERLEQQNPSFSPIPAQMAIIYQKLGDRERGIDKMYRALSIAPENMTYRYNLAIMLDKTGRYDQASQLYSQLLDAHTKGETIPGDATKIQQRLTFIRSNTTK